MLTAASRTWLLHSCVCVVVLSLCLCRGGLPALSLWTPNVWLPALVWTRLCLYLLQVIFEASIPSSHLQPSIDPHIPPASCGRFTIGGVQNCGYDGVGAMLQHFFPKRQLITPPANSSSDPARLISFGQDAYGNATEQYGGLGTTSYVYVPTACADGVTACSLHVALHGCGSYVLDPGVGFNYALYGAGCGWWRVDAVPMGAASVPTQADMAHGLTPTTSSFSIPRAVALSREDGPVTPTRCGTCPCLVASVMLLLRLMPCWCHAFHFRSWLAAMTATDKTGPAFADRRAPQLAAIAAMARAIGGETWWDSLL